MSCQRTAPYRLARYGGRVVDMKKHSVSLTKHELYVIVSALNDRAEASHQERRITEDYGERMDLENEESDCNALAERLDKLRRKGTTEADG